MNHQRFLAALAALLVFSPALIAQGQQSINDSNTQLHLMQSAYDIPYGVPSLEDIKTVTDRVLSYLDSCTPAEADGRGGVVSGTFRLTSYEWGVVYSAMIGATASFGDPSYEDYAIKRMKLLAGLYPDAAKSFKKDGRVTGDLRAVVNPQALDDAGAVCCSMIKAQIADPSLSLTPMIGNYVNWIMNGQYRLADGTFARMRPMANSVWLDDMYMGIPAIAWYGRMTGDTKYTDEAIRQIKLFKDKMWVADRHLFRHGWVEAMDPHPAYHWGRANGWALLTLTEVLDAIPEDCADRAELIDLFKELAAELCKLQSSEGFWHQLLDRNDSFLETSATAIYTGCFAHAISKGWIDALAFGPATILGWNAVATKVNEAGQVEGTCVGTGMAFDPAFYYHRPTHVAAAHGYGPLIMAGAEVYNMIRHQHAQINDAAVHFYDRDYSGKGALFSVTD